MAVARLMELASAAAGRSTPGPGAGDPAVREAAETLAVLLSLFAPYTAEECWEMLGHQPSVALAGWPVADPALLVQDLVTCVVQVDGKVRDRLEVPPAIGEDELRELALAAPVSAGRWPGAACGGDRPGAQAGQHRPGVTDRLARALCGLAGTRDTGAVTGCGGTAAGDGSDAPQHGHDLAEDLGLVAGDRRVGRVVRHQPDVVGGALEGLDRGLAVDHRGDDVAVLGHRLLADDDPVAVGDRRR